MEQGSTGLGEGSGRARERKGPQGPIYSVELEVFEGPLDLLLHLVRKHELDILDIPIAFVAEKYLEYLDVMRQLDLEIAGDYLVMAATLAYLKSRELLPPEPRAGEGGEAEEEDGEDPREALIRRLVEYERFKQAAVELDALPMSGRDVFARGAELVMPPVDPGLAPVSLFNLAEAYYRVLTRAKVKSSHDVEIEPITVSQRIQQLALMLDEKPAFDFEDLFLGRTWNSEKELRQMLVVTLMSILEMVKLGVAGVQQPVDSTTIRIYRRATAEETQRALADYDEDVSFGAPQPAAEPVAREPAPVSASEARPPLESELDAVEEATLLAEALAAVQEPEEPVLGYADEDARAAANDLEPGRPPRSVDEDVPEDMPAEPVTARPATIDGGEPEVVEAVLEVSEPVTASEATIDGGEAAEVVEAVPEASEPVRASEETIADAEVLAAADAVLEVSEAVEASEAAAHVEAQPAEQGSGASETDEPDDADAPSPSAAMAGPAASATEIESEAVPQDSDGEGEARGLFLNTGSGLGSRELDVDDEDGG